MVRGKILEARKEPWQMLHLVVGGVGQAVDSQGRESQRGEWHLQREKGTGCVISQVGIHKSQGQVWGKRQAVTPSEKGSA